MSTGKISRNTVIALIVGIIIVSAFFWFHSNALVLGFTPSDPLCGICH